MVHKLAVALTFLALSTIAEAALTSPSISTNAFELAPTTVYDVSLATDSFFVDGAATGVKFVGGFTNDTVYVFLVDYKAVATNINIIRRTLNATTVAKGDISDAEITTSIQSKISPTLVAGLGYLSITTVNATGDDKIDQVYLNYIAGNSTTPVSVKITSNTVMTTTYYIGNVWEEDGCFYVVYVAVDGSTGKDVGIYLQAVNESSGSTVYSSPQKVATISNTMATSLVRAGPINNTNSTTIFVVYRDSNLKGVVQVPITRSTGVANAATTLIIDTDTISYYPSGVIMSWNVCGVGVQVRDSTSGTTVYSVIIFYNESTSNSSTLALTTPSGYKTPFITGMNYGDGFAIIGAYPTTGADGSTAFSISTYFANGTANISQVSMGTLTGPISSFIDANGALWFGYTSFETSDMTTAKGYLGKLFLQVFSSGRILSTFYTILLFLIAALFVF